MSTTPPPATAGTSATQAATYETATAEQEGLFHNYIGHQIPWYLRVMWLVFWVFAAWYVVSLLLPALNSELLSPP